MSIDDFETWAVRSGFDIAKQGNEVYKDPHTVAAMMGYFAQKVDNIGGAPAVINQQFIETLTVESMCLTMRHDFGLERSCDNHLLSGMCAGMTDTERDFLRSQMRMIYQHHIKHLVAAMALTIDAFDGKGSNAQACAVLRQSLGA